MSTAMPFTWACIDCGATCHGVVDVNNDYGFSFRHSMPSGWSVVSRAYEGLGLSHGRCRACTDAIKTVHALVLK